MSDYRTLVRHAEEWEPELARVAAILAVADRIDALIRAIREAAES